MRLRFHVVGIGGAGMSAIARLLMAGGHQVSGSDTGRWPLSDALARDGALVHDAFAEAHVVGADVVLRSSAYGDGNPEIHAARERGIPVWKRDDAWRFLSEGTRVVAVAGTHGKTTTTAMTWSALREGGIDASLICGAAVAGLGSNAHAGRSDVLVIEADEYDRAFHALSPAVAIVTNVEHDHVDVYPTADSFADAFREFSRRLEPNGALVACVDDAGAANLAAWASRELDGRHVVTYGTSDDPTYRLDRVTFGAAGMWFTLGGPGDRSVEVRLSVSGEHNARNGAAAIAAAAALGVPVATAAVGVARFTGTERRLETLGVARGVLVVDDYAHHPTEIRASIAAVRPRARRVVVVFQPHTPSRLEAFFDEFASALRAADRVFVAETFLSARERSDERGGAKALASASGGDYVRDTDEAARALAGVVQGGDVALILGAGDIRPAGTKLLELLRQGAPA
jgi:UDP-N-acetylmuramate--alanine ligase